MPNSTAAHGVVLSPVVTAAHVYSRGCREGEIKRGDGSRRASVETKIVQESQIASPSRVFFSLSQVSSLCVW